MATANGETLSSSSCNTSNFTVQAPEQFTFCPEAWPRWKQRFERFRIASGLSKSPHDEQVNTLIYLMGEKGDEVFHSLKLSEEEKSNYGKVMEAFENHFIVKHNVIYERAKFNSRSQLEGEKIEDFITSLYTLSEHCKYNTLREEMIRDRLVVGVRDKRVSEKLQLESDLTLERAIQTVRQSDAVHRQQQELLAQTSGIHNLHTPNLRSKPKQKQKLRKNYNNRNGNSGGDTNRNDTQTRNKTCLGCGSATFHKRSQCPAQGKQCNTCKKWNHFSRVCLSSSRTDTKSSTINVINNELNSFLGSVCDGEKNNRWIVDVCVNEVTVKFLVDTGAPINVLPLQEYVEKFKATTLTASNRTLTGPTGEMLLVMGKFTCMLQYKKQKVISSIYVVENLRMPLLSLCTCEALQIISRVNNVQIDRGKSDVRISEEFPELFQGLGCISGEYDIRLKKGAKPYAVNSARRVPIPLMGKLREKLEEMVKMNVIKPVEDPTEWCAPLVIVNKSNGDIRLCVDLTKLNASVERELHPLPITEHSLAQLAGARYFSKLDANSGFWQVKLTQKCQMLTTFITPFGRYCFQRLPFGITSAPEHFQRRMQQILLGLPGVICHMDDILVHGSTIIEHDNNLRATLTRLKSAGITLNKNKCFIGTTNVTFLGHHIDQNGISPESSKVDAIQKYAQPTNVSELRRFLGLVNYLGKFVPHLSHVINPLNDLLRSNSEYLWNSSHTMAFEKVKQLLSSSPGLATFDPQRKTTVSTDASSFGLGAVILQNDEENHLRPVAYASRTLSESERRYAQIEKEALAITWACERFRDYLTGLQFEIETDHKPLIPIFTSKNLNDLTPRLQRLRMRMMRFTFTIKYTPGKQLIAADALSRQPLTTNDETDLEDDLSTYVINVISEIPASDEKLRKIKEAQENDEQLKMVVKYTIEGWPTRTLIPQQVREYWNDRFNFSVNDGLLMYGTRIVIPESLQKDILERIHTGHLGIVKCRARARMSVWWPGCSRDIEQYIGKCNECTKRRIPRHEPLISTKIPERPWEIVAADLFTLGAKQFLIVADFYSRYPEIQQLEDQSSCCVIRHIKSIFARHGVPDMLRSDNGPQFSSVEFRRFASQWNFRHVTSSPRFPQSNGFIESMVKTIKTQVKGNTDPYLAIMEYRATPLTNGCSPAELLMGRRIKTTLPTAKCNLQPKTIDAGKYQALEEQQRMKQEENYNQHKGVISKPKLEPGDVVWVRDMKVWGTVSHEGPTPRSYIVDTLSGPLRRNSYHLTKSGEEKVPYEPDGEITKPSETDSQIREATDCLQNDVTRGAVSAANENVKPDNSNNVDETKPYITRSGRVIRPPTRFTY